MMAHSVTVQQLDEILDEEGNVMLIARDVDGHNTAYINGRSFDVQIDRQARNLPALNLNHNYITLGIENPAALPWANALLVVPAVLHPVRTFPQLAAPCLLHRRVCPEAYACGRGMHKM